MENWNKKECMETVSDDEDSFESLVEKLRRSRKKETRHSEEKVTHLETLLKQQKSEIEDLRKTVKILKSQEFHRKAKYEETSSAPSLTSSDESENESDFDDEGIDSAPHTSRSHSYAEPSHPLLIDLVLETIMEYLPLKSLLSGRQVCRKWYKFAHPHLVTKSDRVILEIHQPWKPSKGNKLKSFMEVMRCSLDVCPVSKYVLRNFDDFSELENFFRKFGPTIKSLDISFAPSFADNGNFRRLLFEYAPFVEHLRIECCSMVESDHFWEYSALELLSRKLVYLKTIYIGNIRGNINLNPNWIKEFFIMTPNLKKLILQVHFKDNGHRFIQIVLNTLLEIGNLDKLKFLFISSVTEENFETLIHLTSKGLQLKTLKFQDICLHPAGQDDQIRPETISRFLTSQCNTLEHLKIDQRSNRIRGFKFPKMNNLKSLTLVSYDELNCGYLNYAHLFPNLESLTLRGYEVFPLDKYFSSENNSTPAGLNLRKLSLPSGVRDDIFVTFLAKLFPNVKQLEIRGASNEFLRSIWYNWPKLEKLKMVLSHFDGSLDAGITGIEQEVCSRMRNNQEFYNVEFASVKSQPGICDLKELKELEIECRSIWIPCNIITDVSGYLALAQMKQLKSFKFTEIGVPEQFDLSDKCIKVIHENLINAEIILKIISDHGRWRLELDEEEAATNMYETEPLLEDHNRDKTFCFEKHNLGNNIQEE